MNIRDNLLVTAGARAAYMDMLGTIELPNGVDGEDKLAECVVHFVDRYISDEVDIPFDEYIEVALESEYDDFDL